ncbi:Na+/H+ antiporter subunit C [Lysobacter sp. D1-1-M9]|uniref:Na+/H+ antiporter subunit C n=1 Tax=Novilysobacter longmucuonensis TaxID=3098603 RepID=UPI002FCAE5E5
MEFALASAIGVLTAAGVYLLLRSRSFDVILGLTLLSYATNLLIFSAGRLAVGKPPVLEPGTAATLANHTDPLPQALVLTAIVIAFAMTAVTIVVAMRSRADNGSDHVDAGGEDAPGEDRADDDSPDESRPRESRPADIQPGDRP